MFHFLAVAEQFLRQSANGPSVTGGFLYQRASNTESVFETWVTYQIRKIAGCACAGNAGNVFPATDFKGKVPLISDPGMHHGTCVTHVPWCMSGSLISSAGENAPSIQGACATHNFTYLARGPWRNHQSVITHDTITWGQSIISIDSHPIQNFAITCDRKNNNFDFTIVLFKFIFLCLETPHILLTNFPSCKQIMAQYNGHFRETLHGV